MSTQDATIMYEREFHLKRRRGVSKKSEKRISFVCSAGEKFRAQSRRLSNVDVKDPISGTFSTEPVFLRICANGEETGIPRSIPGLRISSVSRDN